MNNDVDLGLRAREDLRGAREPVDVRRVVLPVGPQHRRVDRALGAVVREQDADVAGDGLGRLHLGGSSQKISGVPTRD